MIFLLQKKTDSGLPEGTRKRLWWFERHAYLVSPPREIIAGRTSTNCSASIPTRSYGNLLVIFKVVFTWKSIDVAAVISQGDSAKRSIFREEAIEAITDALQDCLQCNNNTQEKSARALTTLGWFSRTGETITEKWLLHKSGFKENQEDTFCRSMNWVSFKFFRMSFVSTMSS